MKRWKNVLLFALSGLAVFFLAGWLLAEKYEKHVRDIIISGINSRLTTPVHVGDISFSFFRRFPSASLNFSDIVIEGSMFHDKGPLLKASSVRLNFNLWDVFGDNISIRDIEIDHASANIYINDAGDVNYDVWASSGSGQSNLNLEEVKLDDVSLSYVNEPSHHDYSFLIEEGKASGIFTSSKYELSANADMKVNRLIADGTGYLEGKEVALDLLMNIDRESGIYTLKKTQLTVGSLVLNASGIIDNKDNENKLDLALRSEGAGMKQLISVIPEKYLTNFNKFSYGGTVAFNATIKGIAGKKSVPLVKAEFTTSNASIQPDGSDHILSNIRLKGTYTNRVNAARPVSYLSFTQLHALLDGQPVEGSLQMENLSAPWVNLRAKGNIDLATLSSFYLPDTFKSLNGAMLLDMEFKGLISKASAYQSSGTIRLKNVSFALKGKQARFENFNGLFALDGNRFSVNDLKGNAAGSDIAVKGSVENLFSYAFRENRVLKGSASISSRNLDLNELLEDKQHSSADDTIYHLDISDRLDFRLLVDIGVMSFRRFQAWDVKGAITINNKTLSSPGVSFKSMGGTLSLSGSINAAQQNNILIRCRATGKKVDITELFADMGNFGQHVIEDKNLRGKLTADILFEGIWSKSLHCNTNSVVVQSTFTIEQGELIRFEPMLALSEYIKGADLDHIRFSTLSNSIAIKERKIYIPSMEIKSSALEMTASGTHTFDNIVDYKIQLLLSQIMGAKVKKMNTEFGTIEDDGLGRTKIFLTMQGPVSDPKIRYDSEAAEKKIVQDVKTEKQNLKTILNKEFGWFKKDSVKTEAPQPKKKKELSIELDAEE